MMVPQLMSKMSPILENVFELEDNFTTGAIGLPVGVPSPVVKRTIFAPDPTSAVVLSTSLPGVQSRFNPGFFTFSGYSGTLVTGDVPPFLAAPADLLAS